MKRREKLLEICAESPASGARFVGQFLEMISVAGRLFGEFPEKAQ